MATEGRYRIACRCCVTTALSLARRLVCLFVCFCLHQYILMKQRNKRKRLSRRAYHLLLISGSQTCLRFSQTSLANQLGSKSFSLLRINSNSVESLLAAINHNHDRRAFVGLSVHLASQLAGWLAIQTSPLYWLHLVFCRHRRCTICQTEFQSIGVQLSELASHSQLAGGHYSMALANLERDR